jgi:hypothetical protein
MEKYGFVYLWRDKKHNRYYVGCHWGTEDDGYVCSCTWMMKAYKIRPNDFKRKILARIYTTRSELLEEEHRWLQMIKPEELKVRYYNSTNRKFNHWSASERDKVRRTISEKTKEAMSRPDVRECYEEGLKTRDCRSSDPEVREKRKQSMLKTMAKKFPVEERIKRAEWGSDEFKEIHRSNTQAMWDNRTEEERKEIAKKTRLIQKKNGTELNGTDACRRANTGTKRLYKGTKYKKAFPNSNKWTQLLSEGWAAR